MSEQAMRAESELLLYSATSGGDVERGTGGDDCGDWAGESCAVGEELLVVVVSAAAADETLDADGDDDGDDAVAVAPSGGLLLAPARSRPLGTTPDDEGDSGGELVGDKGGDKGGDDGGDESGDTMGDETMRSDDVMANDS